ncbi:PspC domain-containing protein [Anaerostipes hadrus]|jgi:phage shock protein C|uniref:PspC domain-containing protein n=2 Tax=Anaerostipes hadrus TaxID=649756 RepID=A0ABX2HWQ7_ANAHA|nr:PspC domain-containing protein [Anaerostipes hadrus]NSH07250.1 PspC domain-containing protein [Anaerostipes hadrus]NSH25708.1 PspC domain-containing protein [Anaerostipes hadrus]NSH44841.1 PspC domain-containing protein [Anaerostipes hadrus]NSH51410.1 PspC domain-containing protein [Anaerostipes hadrus]
MEEKEMKKTLYKSRKDRFLFGVCGGLAEYFEVDPTLVRILTAVLCTTGTGLLLYIVAAVVMPEHVE